VLSATLFCGFGILNKEPDNPIKMKCPFCGSDTDKVVDSRPIDSSAVIRRRRECHACKRRFTTYERPEEMPLMVVKRDQRREPFDRAKITHGIVRSCIKRPVSQDDIEKTVSEIEQELQDYIMEVPSKTIGDMILRKLKKLDEVAYVRFASIYKEFDGLDAFLKELDRLKRKSTRTRQTAHTGGKQ
jgi:transcriptional repressor NrdR